MKKSRIVTYLVLLVVFLFGAYAAFMYVYTEWKFLPVELLQEPSAAAPHAEWKAPNTLLYLHKVNTPRRSARKEKSYDGYEIDLQTDASGVQFGQQFRRFFAVFLRELLKIYVVQKAAQRPKIGLLGVSQFFGQLAHHGFHRQGVEQMERLLVVFF